MKALKMIAVLGMAVLVAAQPSEAGVGKSGLTGAAFLKVGVGARAVALGSAYTTVTGDVNQMFWNPAGNGDERGKAEVLLSHNQWIADLSHQAVGYARDMGDMGYAGDWRCNARTERYRGRSRCGAAVCSRCWDL